MLWWLIPTIFIVISLIMMAMIVLKKIPQLRVIDVNAIPKEKTRQMKERLILNRFERVGSEKLGGVGKVAHGAVKGASKVGRRAVQRLYALEQYYQKLKKAEEGVDEDALKRLLKEADELIRDGEYIQAEKRYIEIINHHPTNISAYEGLGNLYVRDKQYEQARETLQFTLRLSPEDASVHMSLAELELALGNTSSAVEYLRKAVEKRKTNPKYLDIYIEASLSAKKIEDAERGIALLKEANPENQKIAQFEERLKALAV